MLRKRIFIIILFSFAVISFKFAFSVHAQTQFNYQPLAPIPGVTDSLTGADAGNLKSYINNIFKLGIGLCSALAVIMIVYGGFMYVLNSGNEGKVTEARKTIVNAVYGLVLALCIVIILNAVNKDLVAGKLFDDLRVEDVRVDQNSILLITDGVVPILPGQAGYPLQPGDPGYGQPATSTPINSPTETTGLAGEESARSQLTGAGINVNNQSCPQGVRYQDVSGGCTSVGGLPQYAINDLIKLKQACNCDITVTAGSEAGHAEHGDGKPVVDLRYSEGLNAYLQANSGRVSNSLGTFTYESPGGNARGTSTGSHWHVNLSNSGG